MKTQNLLIALTALVFGSFLFADTVLADVQTIVYAPLSGHYNVWKSMSGSYAWENARAKCGQDDVNYSFNDRLCRGYLFLDLSGIPSGSTIKSAKILTASFKSQNGNIEHNARANLYLCSFPNTHSASYLWTNTRLDAGLFSVAPEWDADGSTYSNQTIYDSDGLSILQSGFGQEDVVAIVMKWLNFDEEYCFDNGIFNVTGTADDDWYITALGLSVEIVYTPPQPPSKAINPSPAHGATNQSRYVDISWSDGGGATSYYIYFGTDPTPDSGEYIGEQTGTSYDPGPLLPSTTTLQETPVTFGYPFQFDAYRM